MEESGETSLLGKSRRSGASTGGEEGEGNNRVTRIAAPPYNSQELQPLSEAKEGSVEEKERSEEKGKKGGAMGPPPRLSLSLSHKHKHTHTRTHSLFPLFAFVFCVVTPPPLRGEGVGKRKTASDSQNP